jgi:hypothetical protein
MARRPRLRKFSGCLWLAALLVILCGPTPAAAGAGDPNEPPAVDQPDDFSGAVGVYSIRFRATPTEVAVEDPITLTVIITGTGPGKYLPGRAKLRLFPPEMDKDFFVQPLPEEDRHLAGLWEGVWEFVYRLRPKHAGVKRTPELRFVYYDPMKGLYQPARIRGIPIKVTPRAQAAVRKETTRVPQAPERFYELATGASVLARSGHAGEFYPLLLACLVLAPPGICAAWYALRRRLHPEAGWRARRRRSRAAREALTALLTVAGASIGERTASVLAGYLRQRLELNGAEPTPAEVAVHLGRAGISPGVTGRVAAFFRTCDAARFAPSPPHESAALAADARALVHALEAELCTSQAC